MFRSVCVYALLCTLPTFAAQGNEPEFAIEVMSILSKAGCNAGTCHGNLNGKGGFKLSLRGQDAEHDFQSLVHSSRGRRVNCAAPGESLFLKKASGRIPHRGGIRFEVQSPEYQQLLQWVQNGAPRPSTDAARLVELKVEPESAVVFAPNEDIQVAVMARFSDGQERDVTQRACYELSNLNATVNAQGTVTRTKLGETTLIVRYLDQQLAVPIGFAEVLPDFEWDEPVAHNLVDRHVFVKLSLLKINPSPLCSDSVFIRRVYLDALGRMPTADEAREFVFDQGINKRWRLVDRVLARPEFADYWALKFADILRTEEKVLDPKGVEIFHGWIRENIASDRPLDQIVHDLVTGVGSTFEHPAANYYRANRDPATRGETTARLFLGTRLQCAKCHNHPFDRWTQDDYYQWSSLFSQIDYELGENKRKDDLDKNEFAGEQIVLVAKKDEVRNPTSGQVAVPKFLGGAELPEAAAQERLQAVAEWLTAPENDLFAKSQANFVWYHVMGQGLVDPIDDFRLTNPTSNPPLLDTLAAELIDSGFDLRHLIRTIMMSRTYQTSYRPVASNHSDATSYSRGYVRRLPAEVLLDMQSDFLELPARFAGYPLGIRAVQIPGVHKKRPREEPPKAGDRFLTTFGKPERILACDCERSNETNLKQVLGLLGAGLDERLAQSPGLRRLADSSMSDSQVIDEMYWSALSRPPTAAELDAALQLIRSQEIDPESASRDLARATINLDLKTAVQVLRDASAGRQTAIQDLAWALMNAKEFLFRR